MKSKREAWVVLRLDGPAVSLADHVSVKGVYDSADEARGETARLSEAMTSNASYHVVKTRRFVSIDDDAAAAPQRDSIQGFRVPERSLRDAPDGAPLAMTALRLVFASLSPDVRRQAAAPVLGHLAEKAVAASLRAQRVTDAKVPWDLKLADGDRVEVKSVLLSEEASRAPHVQLRSLADFEWLAIVIFRPDLSLEAAKLIPVNTLRLFVRSESEQPRHRSVGLRVTPAVLNAPGSKDIFQSDAELWTSSTSQNF